MRRCAAFLICIFMVAALSGCQALGIDSEAMMRPPGAAGDGQAIQAALENELGTQFTLRYPRSGSHRSAIMRADLDNDLVDEAVVFYRAATESTGARIAILDTGDDGWSIVYNGSGNGSDVDRVLFGDVDGDGRSDMVIGWSTYTGSTVITAHRYYDGTLSDISVTETAEATGATAVVNYNELVMSDFDNDSVNELLVAVINSKNGSSCAKLVKYQSVGGVGELTVVSSVELAADVTGYARATTGNVGARTPALILDGYRGTSTVTAELVLWDSALEQLIAPLSADSAQSLSRDGESYPRDIDGDMLLEIPCDRPMTGSEPGSGRGDTLYLTSWCRFDQATGTLIPKLYTLCCEREGFYLAMPQVWIDSLAVVRDPAAELLYFYRVADEGLGEEVFRIQVFSHAQWSEIEKTIDESAGTRFEIIAETEYNVYTALIARPDESLDISLDSITGRFMLINE